MSVQGMTALIIAISGLLGSLGAFWHSVQTRKQIPPPGEQPRVIEIPRSPAP